MTDELDLDNLIAYFQDEIIRYRKEEIHHLPLTQIEYWIDCIGRSVDNKDDKMIDEILKEQEKCIKIMKYCIYGYVIVIIMQIINLILYIYNI